MKKLLTVCCSACALLIGGTAMTAIPVKALPSASYTDYVTISENGSGIMLEPTLVLEPETFAELTPLKEATQKPASVILTPNASMTVELSDGTKSLADAFDTYIKGTFIPVVRLDTATVTPFINWLTGTYNISDIMAISSDITVIEKLYADKQAGYLVNTVYDLTATTLSADRYAEWTHIGQANKAGCNILMYSVQPNLSVAAEYVEAMAKVCWAVADTKEKAVEAMAAGCYGVVSSDFTAMSSALGYFEKSGFARAQYIAAHRGITAYCNEQSRTAIAASANEGATHIELDLQVTKDKNIVIGHDNNTSRVADKTYAFANATLEQLRSLTLVDYSRKYGDTIATLEETIELLIDTDIIFIFELKLDGASTKAVDELGAIEVLKTVLDKYPKMQGRWIAIAFYEPYATKMMEIFPEVPVGYLGGANSGKATEEGSTYPKNWGGTGYITRATMTSCMKNILRKYNVSLDEMTYDNVTGQLQSVTNSMSAGYLARGYAQNTWTFDSLLNYTIKCNIATTNAAEMSAMHVKTIGTPASLTATQLTAKKATVPCVTYNGWKVEKDCDIIVVSQEGNKAKVLFYLEQTDYLKQTNSNFNWGLYSNLVEVTIA